jgi:hypothetical protein
MNTIVKTKVINFCMDIERGLYIKFLQPLWEIVSVENTTWQLKLKKQLIYNYCVTIV